jgi:GNAT superfamily N-acetyltransferase
VDAELQVPAERHFSRADTPIGMVKTMVVREAYQGQGIGSRLGAKAMSETFFEDSEVDTVIAVAWVRPDNRSNIALAEFYGDPIAEYDEYYGESRDCSICPEDDYCSCTYRIYQTEV